MSRAAIERLERWGANPKAFVRNVFGVRPDAWQDDVLEAFPSQPRLAMKACKGPGKTAVLAWLAWYFLMTRPDPKIAATSVSGDNLADNLWAEMAKWQARSPLLTAAFEWTKTRIFHRERPETWWMSAAPGRAPPTRRGSARRWPACTPTTSCSCSTNRAASPTR